MLDALVDWIFNSTHRKGMLRAIAKHNWEDRLPSGLECMSLVYAGRSYTCPSHRSNGQEAIRGLIRAGLVDNKNPGRGKQKLAVDWHVIALLCGAGATDDVFTSRPLACLADLVWLTANRYRLYQDVAGLEEAKLKLAKNRFLEACQ